MSGVKNSIFSTDYISLEFISKDLPVLIAFSSVNTPKGRFKPYKIPKDTKLNIIFVNDRLNSWYIDGIEGISNDANESARILIEYARKIGNGRVVTFGTSMGAYAAILYAILGSADGFMAFGPESVMMKEGSRSRQHFEGELVDKYSSLDPYIAKSNMPNCIFIPENDEVDLSSLSIFSKYSWLNIYCMKGCEHPSIQLFEHSKVCELIYDFANNLKVNIDKYIDSSFVRKDLSDLDTNVVKLLNSSYIQRLKGNLILSLNGLLKIKGEYTNTSSYYLKLGEAYRRLGKSSIALEKYYQSVELFKYQYEALAKIAAEEMRLGNLDVAYSYITRAIEIYPNAAHQYNTQGILLEKFKDYHGAERAYRRAYSLNKSDAFKLNLKNFLLNDISRKAKELKTL